MKLNEVLENIDVWKGWVNSYKRYVPQFIEEAKHKEKWEDWDKDVFREYFEQARDQCVSSLQQGYFTHAEKDKLRANWGELAPLFKQISESQTIPLYDVYKKIEDTIRRYTTQHRRASTYRLIAGLQPELLCTIVNQGNLYELFVMLKNNVEEPIANYTGNWYKDSFTIAQYYKENSETIKDMDLIAYPWQTIVYFKEEKEITNNEMSEANTDSKGYNSLNQILYGPPGTGKTYHTINKAIAICNPSFNLNQERKLVKEEFDKLVKDGQIVFTTFHQSMSYEDFIEGIKPVMKGEEENEVGYEIQDGLFKVACAHAAYNCYKAYKKDNKPTSTYSFDELYEAFIENIQSLMEAGTPPIFKTLTGKEITVIKITSTGSIKARAYNSVAKRNPAPLTKENLQKLYDKFETIDAIKNLKQVEETVEVTPRITEFYAVFKGLKAFEKEEFKPETDETALDFITLEEKIRNFNERVYNRAIKEHGLNAEPVVLIIDEINRGNVSQIFGELITLIEDSKRLGNDEALEITLPYSKKKFGVPPNLYIIGTMNTADRSVEALDTALRRRFCFEEMMPDYEVLENKNIEGIELAELLKTINNRIEVLLDRDHTIGHSYFLNVHSLEDLKNTFKNNIIPLLQEYFYNDYGKIGLVLGKSFVRANAMTAKNDTSIFADFYTKNEIDIIKSYELIPFEAITDIKKACLDLLGKTTNTINELTNLEASVN